MKQTLLFLLFLLSTIECYKIIRLQDFLCEESLIYAIQKPFRGDPKFTLTEDGDSGAIITQVWNTSLPGHNNNNKLKYDCQFRVHTLQNKRYGIYTILTLLKFRQNPTTGACIDYIQFLSGNRSPSEAICSNIDESIAFDQREGDVIVRIHVDKRRMIHEPLELRMVMTAHSECSKVVAPPVYTNQFQCNPDDSNSCISRKFYRDNVTNCFNPCLDEVSCFPGNQVTAKEIDSTDVAISAITSLIFTMLGVGFLVWICWKYWNCITEQQHAHEASAAAHRRAAREIPTIVDLPTAPTFDTVLSSSSIEMSQQQLPKDLPPSYEELFPDR